MGTFTCVEICAGAGGQSLGLELAGFEHALAVEIDPDACETLRLNRPEWDVREVDVHHLDGAELEGTIDLFAGGVPCPPFSIAGKQLGADDERDLFPQALRLIEEMKPKAVMLENVKGLATARFKDYRKQITDRLEELGYKWDWQVLNSSEMGVPQLRPRFILVALQPDAYEHFQWPHAEKTPPTVGETLRDLMGANGWPGIDAWVEKADAIAPTLVGGSRKHGGPDLGPTRARAAWLRLGVDGRSIAAAAPSDDDAVDHTPKLTLEMVAKIQGFPAGWKFSGRKTAAYRQIGNAFPPPVAKAIGEQIKKAIEAAQAASRNTNLRAVS
ncbi:DNA (cytosine-5-)-methyltransferase [Nostocoides sp. F2B08]|uniref:DNA cytosine methyltransferase n=1 Tax=Nostocoides sp. F2B08 TaxID=2653936 RepID=UPI00126337AA|nr:DNA cytosine methyltransferase [Tetrasphaera sp. F2B08]KAB7742941.1 DNA (cytosine-5-)-methyltransferase [Tetrasphaera sp. F2B08]